MSRSRANTVKIVSAALFLLVLLVVVPLLIAATGRSDLYYTLTSVALLSIISAGVWITFYIGRINIGQGAYALMGGYVSAILVMNYGVSFWLTLPLAASERRRNSSGDSTTATSRPCRCTRTGSDCAMSINSPKRFLASVAAMVFIKQY